MSQLFAAIDHTGIAVTDLDAASDFYRNVLDLPVIHRETILGYGVEAALFDVGDSHIELIAPLEPGTAVARFLEQRGPGLHHVAYRVNDIGATLARLSAAGVRLIDEQPRTGIRGTRVAFLHPRATGGALTELVESA